MRAHIASRLRSSSLSAIPPPQSSADYSSATAKVAASILYRTPIPSQTGHPIYILNAAALPDADDVDFDTLLPYVLARLPGEEELIGGTDYEVIFFAGGNPDTATSGKKNRPGWGWFIQAYHVLSRAMRKRLQKLYIVHERSWVRILVEMFSTIVSPKFRRKIVHISSLSALALHMPIEDLLIPPSAYLHDRRQTPDIHSPYSSGRRAFTVKEPLPRASSGQTRLPRVLREATSFLLLEPNVTAEGIFRVPAHMRLRDILREAYDRGQKFIVWKDNGVTLPLPRYPRAQNMDQIIDEVDTKDSYNVFLAAGLIKLWYSELRQPIFPESSYSDLKTLFGDPAEEIALEKLVDLISPHSEWSKLPLTSRVILVRHLLPLLSIVSSRSEQNKMTAENLAVCFAPALLCGPDQLEDAKIISILRRIITASVEKWPGSLREACKAEPEAFTKDLLLPNTPADWEDPLEAPRRPLQAEDDSHVDEKHFTGIIMSDNDKADEAPPPLPPRLRRSNDVPSSSRPSEDITKRKPVPSLSIPPPRYSTIVDEGSIDVAESPATYATTTDGFAPAHWSSQAVTGYSGREKAKLEGTSDSPPTDFADQNALTSEQVHDPSPFPNDKANLQSMSDGRRALPGLTGPLPATLVHRKPLNQSSTSSSEASSRANTATENIAGSRVSPNPSPIEFRKPSWSASSMKPSLPTSEGSSSSSTGNRAPAAMTSLARPVYPTHSLPRQPSTTSNLSPPVLPKPRAVSAGLLHRMPSFEQREERQERPSLGPRPGRLNLQKASVEDLRRLYEERVPAAQTLVKAGKHHG